MSRPRDENGKLLPQAHRRLPNAAALEYAAVSAISADRRCAHMELKRRLAIARKAIDHVTDGTPPPRSLFRKDETRPDNTVLAEAWRAAVEAVRALGAAA